MQAKNSGDGPFVGHTCLDIFIGTVQVFRTASCWQSQSERQQESSRQLLDVHSQSDSSCVRTGAYCSLRKGVVVDVAFGGSCREKVDDGLRGGGDECRLRLVFQEFEGPLVGHMRGRGVGALGRERLYPIPKQAVRTLKCQQVSTTMNNKSCLKSYFEIRN